MGPMSADSQWDAAVLAAQDHPHYVQGAAWAHAKAGSPWAIDRRTVAGVPVQLFQREAEGYGILQHLPRVSGIRPAMVPELTEALREGRGDAFSLKLEAYQPRVAMHQDVPGLPDDQFGCPSGHDARLDVARMQCHVMDRGQKGDRPPERRGKIQP